MRYKKSIVLLIFIITSFVIISQSANLKIKVIVERANIRLKPDIKSPVIGKAALGEVFEIMEEVKGKEGKWYMIKFKSKEGYTIYGYIHSSIVEVVKEEKPIIEEKPPSPPIPPKPPIAPPPPKPVYKPPEAVKKSFFIRANIGYGAMTYSYENNWEFTEYYETGSASEEYEINSSGILFEGGIGFYFIKNLGLELSFNPTSGKTKGTFSVSFPHPFYFNQHREKSWENEDLKYSAQEINLNLIINFQMGEKIFLYISGGGTYFLNVTVENLKVINWSEIGYPYNDVNMSPEYGEYSNSTFGFNGGGGLDFFISENLGLNFNFRYSTGTVKINVEGTEIEIKPGGLRTSAGIKFAF